MTPKTEKAYRAWRTAAERGYGTAPCINVSTMMRVDKRIASLKAKYEALLLAEKKERETALAMARY